MRISAGLCVALLAFPLLLILSFTCFAQNHESPATSQSVQDIDPERLSAAREVLRLTNAEEMLSKTYPAIVKQTLSSVMNAVQPKNISPEQKHRYNDMSDGISDVAADFISNKKNELLNLSAAVYARTFTREELEALAAFYGKPAGQKFVSVTPELMQETMPLMNSIVLDKPIEMKEDISPEALAAAKEMMRISKTEEMLDTAMSQLRQSPAMVLPDADPAIEKDLKKNSEDVAKKFQARRSELIEALASVWAQKFTVEEMTAVTDFYKTDAGQKIITSMPQLMAEMQQASQLFYQQLMGEMVEKARDMVKEQGNE